MYARDSDRSKSSGPGLAAAILLLLSGGMSLAASWNIVQPMDFYQFWFVTRTNLHGIERPYATDAQAALSDAAESRLEAGETGPLEARTLEKTKIVFGRLADGRMIQSTGTPLLYATVALISNDSFEVTARVAQVIVMLAYIAMFLLVGYAFRLSAIALIASWAVLWTCLAPACFDVYFVNVSGFQTFMLVAVAYLIATKRFVLAGVLAAYAALFKPTAAYPVVALTTYLAAQCDWRATSRFVIGGFVGGLLAMAVTIWSFGSAAVWADWFTLMLPQVAETTYSVERGNYGLNSLILEIASVRATGTLTVLIFGTVALLAAARGWASRRREIHFAEPFWVMSAAVAAMLLSAPLTWLHYYVLVLPAVMVLACRPGIFSRIVAVLLVVGYSQLSFIQLPDNVALIRAMVAASLFAATTVAVLVSCLAELRPNELLLSLRERISLATGRSAAIRTAASSA